MCATYGRFFSIFVVILQSNIWIYGSSHIRKSILLNAIPLRICILLVRLYVLKYTIIWNILLIIWKAYVR